MAGTKSESGYYGTENETFVVGARGGVYLVQGPDLRAGETHQRVAALPASARRLSDDSCLGLEIADECWELSDEELDRARYEGALQQLGAKG